MPVMVISAFVNSVMIELTTTASTRFPVSPMLTELANFRESPNRELFCKKKNNQQRRRNLRMRLVLL